MYTYNINTIPQNNTINSQDNYRSSSVDSIPENPFYVLNNDFSQLSHEFNGQKAYTNVMDLLQALNLTKIHEMSNLQDNWNGYGAKRFTRNALNTFTRVIQHLYKQPLIAPSGRNSLFLQYDKPDKSILAFEVFEDQADMVYIPLNAYDKAKKKTIVHNLEKEINDNVVAFYGHV